MQESMNTRLLLFLKALCFVPTHGFKLNDWQRQQVSKLPGVDETSFNIYTGKAFIDAHHYIPSLEKEGK